MRTTTTTSTRKAMVSSSPRKKMSKQPRNQTKKKETENGDEVLKTMNYKWVFLAEAQGVANLEIHKKQQQKQHKHWYIKALSKDFLNFFILNVNKERTPGRTLFRHYSSWTQKFRNRGGGKERLTYLVYRRKMQMNIKPENDTRILIAFEVTKTSARKNSKTNSLPQFRRDIIWLQLMLLLPHTKQLWL